MISIMCSGDSIKYEKGECIIQKLGISNTVEFIVLFAVVLYSSYLNHHKSLARTLSLLHFFMGLRKWYCVEQGYAQ